MDIEPQLWVEGARAAVTFYQAAFDAIVLYSVGDGDDIVVQLSIGESRIWVTEASQDMKRFSPIAIGGRTGRTLLIVDEPQKALDQAIGAGAILIAPVADEHSWRLGRIIDPFGHEWEIGRPLGIWPPTEIH